MPDGRILVSNNETDYIIVRRILQECKTPLDFVTGSIEWNKYKKWLSGTPTENSARMLFGENIQRFYLAPPARRSNNAFINEVNVRRLYGIAIVTQRTTAIEQPWRIIATMIDSEQESLPIVTENHTNVFTIESKRHGLYCLGLLNSRFMDYFFRLFNSNTQVSSGELNALPFPATPSVSSVKKIESLVDRILSTKAANASASTTEMEDEIDKEVYALYGLSQPEIDVVESRRAAATPRGDATTKSASRRVSGKAGGSRPPSTDDDDYLE